MKRALEEAIQGLRDLPEEEQDAVAMVIFAYISSDVHNELLGLDDAATTRSAPLR
jgi:hypothetical protein